ncbi:glycosyl transferase family 2 [Burkholderia pseudomallei]|uniref:Glycosyl transferase family 2 n=3 Tax=Burkholderia pseudomallei TaxID=28450 RepID=A0AAX0UBE9_BURPE|nr:glycosyl transferase family 2 [Burkholderia pseudomallei]PNW98714.1 glycosyl transferase family 2 [Burkholderia sp. 136(2017)]PNX14524.1 glycosyl transferase family 2 [Burkholderia sp. 129]PNX25175.1 glycosyl transferase family 2 [Burkholderia sp. 117]PNX35104.1 glycosyl transferase family 2 [Burkholderia sp. 137]
MRRRSALRGIGPRADFFGMGGTRVCDRFTPALPSPLQSPRALPVFNAFLPSPRCGRKGRLARLSSATSRR